MKIALVTGITNGIGFEILKELSNKNYYIHGTYFKDKNKAQEISNKYNNLNIYKVNLCDRVETDEFLKKLNGIRFDVLINNAGFYLEDSVENSNIEEWDTLIEGLLTAPTFIIKRLLNNINQEGSIINLCSIYGTTVFPSDSLGYLAAKSGLQAITKALSVSLKDHGIRVNGISPGIVDTKIVNNKNLPEDVKKKIIKETPIGKICQPEDIAKVVSFLLTEESKFINGQIIVVDGGHTNYNSFFNGE